jgi:D-lactate dehydrogenase
MATLAPANPQPTADRAPDWVAHGTPEPLRGQLIAALGPEQVLHRATDLVRYASDASPYRMIPKAIVRPRDVADVSALLRVASQQGAPVVFRAGGTSLNGQSQTDSILADVRHHWQRARAEQGGALARLQPGVTLGLANRLLARHGRRLGPDPASTNIACVGGVVANNSGGMRCGVVADSYQTVRSMRRMPSNGSDTTRRSSPPGSSRSATSSEPTRSLPSASRASS